MHGRAFAYLTQRDGPSMAAKRAQGAEHTDPTVCVLKRKLTSNFSCFFVANAGPPGLASFHHNKFQV